MTRVDFYFNVSDKLKKTSELAQKAVIKQRKVMVCVADNQQAMTLSEQLWGAVPASFLAHALVLNMEHHDTDLHNNGIVINAVSASEVNQHLNQDDVLINLQPQQPAFFSRFRHLIELVGTDEADKIAGRIRYKYYRDRGYEIKSVDVNAT